MPIAPSGAFRCRLSLNFDRLQQSLRTEDRQARGPSLEHAVPSLSVSTAVRLAQQLRTLRG